MTWIDIKWWKYCEGGYEHKLIRIPIIFYEIRLKCVKRREVVCFLQYLMAVRNDSHFLMIVRLVHKLSSKTRVTS